MERRTLGSEGLEVSEQGLGCMGMSAWYGPTDEAESIATIHRALELGISFLDTADVYGQGANEELVGRAIAGRRDEVVLATKFGNRWFDDGRRTIDGSPDYVRLRIGIGHPGSAPQVSSYVLKRAPSSEQTLIDEAIERARQHITDIVHGQYSKVMNALHTK